MVFSRFPNHQKHRALALLFTVSVAISTASAAGVPLEKRVKSYWEALQRGDLAEAVLFVNPASRRLFQQRQSLTVADWRLQAIRAGAVQAEVTLEVRFNGIPGGAPLPGRVTQIWRRADGDWFLEIPESSPVQINRRIYGKSAIVAVQPGVLSVEPSRLVLHFLNPVQRGIVTVSNGRKQAAQLLSCSSDSAELKARADFDRIPPGGQKALIVTLENDSEGKTPKNQSAMIHCRFRLGDDQEMSVEIPVLYNYISKEERAFLGLTDEQAQTLRHGDQPSPAARRPE